MEVFQTENFYILVKRDKSLWWNRTTSEFSIKAGWDLSSVDDIECIGITHGIVGVISLPGVYEPHLVVVKEATPVGVLYPPNLVYKIKSICILSLDSPDSVLTSCTRHSQNKSSTTPIHKPRIFEANQLMNKTWGAVKSAGASLKNTTTQAAVIASNQVKSSVGIRDPSRIQKRITEELHKIFDDSDSFYFCFECDITNNLQRRKEENSSDERFFWNMHMISEIIKLNDKTWILPIIQGFVQVEQCVIGNECFTLALVSRRSRHRAGTRYKRRGIDDNGNCANYVETEQILSFHHHQLSFTQVRGSVPIYWSQPGYKYRPPPKLDRAEPDTQEAFEKHFLRELSTYGGVCVVNLVEQSGKEKIIADAYAKHIIKYNNEQIIYVTFDFHDYCRGMRFENVTALIEALGPEAGSMGFHWRDARGVICDQKSVFRINCMDCLDRTNVVQTAIGKAVLESQLVKLGWSPPYTPIPEQLKAPFMALWANNGDIISRQYAGTNALKGDYTRTGERKLAGMVKDGMNSANRYYLARFKDSYRQATIDLMLGNQVSAESLNALGGQQAPDDNDALEGAEHAKLLVEDCRRLLLGAAQFPIASWGLIDADPNSGDINETEVDIILLLTNDCYFVADYDSHLDKIVRFEKVLLKNVTMIELGMYQQTKIFQSASPALLCIRISYIVDDTEGYFHMFRSANIRFFNNVAVVIKTQEEVLESFEAIVESFKIALENIGRSDVRYINGGILQRRKSKVTLLDVPKGMPRNLSESQLVQMSSKAFNNVTGQFSKLGQSLSSGKKSSAGSQPNNTTTQLNPQVMRLNHPIEYCMEAENAAISVESHKNVEEYINTSDSEDNDNSIFEPVSECGAVNEMEIRANCERSGFNGSDFLPSVGIVMCPTIHQATENNVKQLEIKDSVGKLSEDLLTISISSVTDHVTLPAGLLENAIPVRPRSSTPEIRIEATDVEQSGTTSPKDLSLPVRPMTQVGETLKNLKATTSPISKFAKGMQNFSMNLDPRKIGSKSGVFSPSLASPSENSPPELQRPTGNQDVLERMWEESKCRTKLIAL